MTVGSEVKQCFYTLRSIEEGLKILADKTQDTDAKNQIFQAAVSFNEAANELKERISFLEKEEPQYKGL